MVLFSIKLKVVIFNFMFLGYSLGLWNVKNYDKKMAQILL